MYTYAHHLPIRGKMHLSNEFNMPDVYTLDLQFRGVTGAIASYLVPHETGAVLVECGPGSTIPVLQARLVDHGYKPADITDILLTHIHLDHAGAAGWFAERGVRIHVHPVGAPHMVNPEKLLSSAARIYGEQMDLLWGEFLPVPESQLVVHEDQEQIEIEQLTFQALDTPGHASHHFVYTLDGICFSGDIGGVRMAGVRHLRLPMPPPEFHPGKWRQSLTRLRQEKITEILPTHFGKFSDIGWQLDAIERALDQVENWMEKIMPQNLPFEQLTQEFLKWESSRSLEDRIDPDDQQVYQTANPVEISLLGIQRYWKKYRQDAAR
jgi:glyoxylase-like metal-dependent hydrolase (beta-lactamase superfamily II)